MPNVQMDTTSKGRQPLTKVPLYLNYVVHPGEQISYVIMNMLAEDIQSVINYATALQYVEVTILPLSLELFSSIENLTSTLKILNGILLGSFKSESYRTEWMWVFKDHYDGMCPKHQKRTSESVLTKIKNMGATDVDILIYQQFINDMRHYGSAEEVVRHQGTIFFDMMKKYIFVPLNPCEVNREMDDFVKNLQDMLVQKVNCIKIAAYCHARITDIHPFRDGNGRLARLIMNVILMKEGHLPVIFECKKDYDEAIKSCTFETFLIKSCASMEKTYNRTSIMCDVNKL